MMIPVTARLYGILDLGYVPMDRALDVGAELLRGGVDVLQLRAKTFAEPDIIPLARLLVPACRAAGVPFIINDHPHLVPVVGADGAHIGQDDGPLALAREQAGEGAIIGRSTHSVEQARAAWLEGADYIGFGPLFATPTKPDYAPIGTEDIATVQREAPVPVFCIGGIKRANLASVRAAGARRVVVVSDLLLADNVAGAVAECRRTLAG